jgi:subtilisin family serine protease
MPITVSEKIMFVKFIPGVSNSQKQGLITQAQVDLQNADWNDIPDLVQLKSRILQQLIWIYPCGIPGNKKLEKGFDSTKYINGPGMISKCTPPCPPPPGDTCIPYQVWQSYDNFYQALFFFADNTSVRSSSNAIIKSTTDTIATCEDFFIKIKPGYTINDFSSLISFYSLTAADASADFGTGVYKISESTGGSRFCIERANIFFGTGMCDFSVPDFHELHPALTNDPLWNQQWSLLNTGQHSGIVGADIRVVPAWAFTRGSNVNVAVIDEGIQLDHTDLQANLLPGYDAIFNTPGGGPINNIKDKHGTACAGIIGAIADNNFGISGVAPECRIIPIRGFSDSRKDGSTESIARAINWAWQNGADIISNSYKWDSESDLIDMAIHNASTQGRGNLGSIVIYGSGNSGGSTVKYPGRLPEAIAVGNMSMCNQRANPQSCDNKNSYGSSYGVDLDLMAPGMKIATLDLGGGTTTDFGGTSAACPHVAGVVALMLSANPNLTLPEVRRILQYSCNKVGAYCYNWTSDHPDGPWNNQMGYGRINAYNAVQLALRATSFSAPTYNVISQNNSLVSNNYFQLIVLNSGCSTLPSSVYFVQRYEVTTNINYATTPNPLIICNSSGWSAANPNEGKNFATATNITSTSATLKAWVYKGYNSIGQFLGWFPTSPENVKFSYSVIGANSSIDYQLLRTTSTTNNVSITGSIPFQFDEQGTVNDRIIILNDNKVFINPNPSGSTINLTCNLREEERISFIEILNINGQIIQTMNLNSKSPVQKIDISKLKSGFYILRVTTNKGIYNKNMIKQ